MSGQRLPILVALAICTLWPPAAKARDEFVSAVRAGAFLFAPVSINHSQNTWWLLDTGASVCEFDLSIARTLRLERSTKLRLKPSAKNRGEHAYFVQAPDMSVGTIGCGPLPLLVRPLSARLNQGETPAHWTDRFERTGLLGMNLLLPKRALILWKKQRIYLEPTADEAKSRGEYEADGYTAIPFSITADQQIQVDATVGSSHYLFCLDTGTPRTMLERSVVETEHLPSRLTESEVRSPMKEFSDSKVSLVASTRFHLGDFDLSNHELRAASFHLSIGDTGGIWAGLIGTDLLSTYDAVIDLGSKTLYLRRTMPSTATQRDTDH